MVVCGAYSVETSWESSKQASPVERSRQTRMLLRSNGARSVRVV
jgi:hypothetical protein